MTGRPLIQITPEILLEAETLAAQGLTMAQIALALGMGHSTLYEKKESYPEFSDAIESGKAKGIATITNALFQNAKKGDTQAQKYYLNNRDKENWKDRVHNQTDVTSGGEKISIASLSDAELSQRLKDLGGE